MYAGAQVSLYPMADDFVGIILGALHALDPYRDALRIETDDISTLMVGPPEKLFPAMRDLFVAAAKGGTHCVLSACVSRGCPGEPDDPFCTPAIQVGAVGPLKERIEAARNAVVAAALTGQQAAAQFSHYPLGVGHHMDEIYGCIEFLKTSGVFDRPKNFCTKLRGDAGPVFATLEQAFLHFGAPPEGHVTLDVTVSANSPTKA
ncbi:YkoF family thiamine/hydroxymethylpyrimidine-binding protein [Chelativorans sp.]|uniref:YkoF family thiamine/hydroxymethylpyrimidine-binding protein n=1 Tax=Chelativorans sp. TaxID=2203393 RepID=UPI0028119830|nr:YkoF family thiamine/hydroxymethylpyrimidine-binding protein [Chelativorans sp.]